MFLDAAPAASASLNSNANMKNDKMRIKNQTSGPSKNVSQQSEPVIHAVENHDGQMKLLQSGTDARFRTTHGGRAVRTERNEVLKRERLRVDEVKQAGGQSVCSPVSKLKNTQKELFSNTGFIADSGNSTADAAGAHISSFVNADTVEAYITDLGECAFPKTL